MKKIALLYSSMAVLLLSACGVNATTDNYKFPTPGTVLDSVAMPIVGDTLNNMVFSVAVVADSNIAKGVYDVNVIYGKNEANGLFTMPKGAEKYKPAIRKSTEPYTYIIGFHAPKDTTFYEYFEVTAQKKTIGMKYLKAYTFE